MFGCQHISLRNLTSCSNWFNYAGPFNSNQVLGFKGFHVRFLQHMHNGRLSHFKFRLLILLLLLRKIGNYRGIANYDDVT